MIDWDEIMWALPLTFELAGRWRSHVGTTVGGMISLAAVVVQYGCCESMVRHRWAHATVVRMKDVHCEQDEMILDVCG